jgi:DNA-binding MarR family transcriptional regulator
MRATKPAAPDYLAVARFRAALRSFDNAAEEAARGVGLTMQRYLLLLMVKGAPSGEERATINEVAERLKVEAHTITGAVGRAEEAGLVTREQCTEDRRRMWIRLTRKGERRLEQVVTALQAQREELVAAIEAAAGSAREIATADNRAQRGRARPKRSSR